MIPEFVVLATTVEDVRAFIKLFPNSSDWASRSSDWAAQYLKRHKLPAFIGFMRRTKSSGVCSAHNPLHDQSAEYIYERYFYPIPWYPIDFIYNPDNYPEAFI